MMNARTMKVTSVIVAVVVLAVAYFVLFVKQDSGYSVIYMSTGEIYIGHLSTFPRFTLADGYIFQVTPDSANPGKNTFQLTPFKEALWAPQYVHINADQVIFFGPLLESSNIYQTLMNSRAKSGPASDAPATPANGSQENSKKETNP